MVSIICNLSHFYRISKNCVLIRKKENNTINVKFLRQWWFRSWVPIANLFRKKRLKCCMDLFIFKTFWFVCSLCKWLWKMWEQEMKRFRAAHNYYSNQNNKVIVMSLARINSALGAHKTGISMWKLGGKE